MVNDLLFSVLPREGKVPIAHDSQKVAKIDKQEALRVLSDEEKELKGEEREARQKQQKGSDKKHNPESEASTVQADDDSASSKNKPPKGPKHLDIYV